METAFTMDIEKVERIAEIARKLAYERGMPNSVSLPASKVPDALETLNAWHERRIYDINHERDLRLHDQWDDFHNRQRALESLR